jgi:hypothetical protein
VKKNKFQKSKDYTVNVKAESVMRESKKTAVSNIESGFDLKSEESSAVNKPETKVGSDVRMVEELYDGIKDLEVKLKESRSKMMINRSGIFEDKRSERKTRPGTCKRNKSKEKLGNRVKVDSGEENDLLIANGIKVRKGTRSLEDLERLVDGSTKDKLGTKAENKSDLEIYSNMTNGYAGGLARLNTCRLKSNIEHFDSSGSLGGDSVGVEKHDTENLKEIKLQEIASKLGSQKSAEGSDLLWDVSNDWMVRSFIFLSIFPIDVITLFF